MAMSVRLDPETEALVRRISRSSRRSHSEVIRDAIRRMATEIPAAYPDTVYDRIADIVAIAQGGRRRYAGRSEEVLRALFARKRWRR
ncbi:MAG: ribbon-helix-helix protein, CopG family [Bacillati bacterium ANGP1]|uniref:Ribbon-helix-helix protein, CopG family n=1 Tax=Candidatus Segetimicrobium genomatis TaxID=2569760 RepID=A0A537J6A7_9BACT|nr:MAG: ribbon-helix-helix protein, CopG family [Terrabacteria group bacterium ANGP1]